MGILSTQTSQTKHYEEEIPQISHTFAFCLIPQKELVI